MIDALSGNTTTRAVYQPSALVAPATDTASFADTLSTDADRKAEMDDRNAARDAALNADPLERQRRLAEISGRYDVTNISPTEIDKMNNELYEAGYEPASDLFSLWNRGAEFERALARSAADHFGQPVDEAALDRKMSTRFDFLQATKDQREFAVQNGDPTRTYDEVLRGLDRVGQWGDAVRRRPEGFMAADTMGMMITAQEQSNSIARRVDA